MTQNVPYYEMVTEWDRCSYVGFCQSVVQLQTGRTAKRLSHSTVCLATEDCRDLAKLALGVYLIGARSPLHFEFDGVNSRKQFDEFICSHVDMSQPLNHFPPEDTMQEAASRLMHVDTDRQESYAEYINLELSMRMNQRIAQAAGEQLVARALLATVPGSQTVGMALRLTNSYGDSTVVNLKCDRSRISVEDELVAYHLDDQGLTTSA